MGVEQRIYQLEEEHQRLDKKINGLESTGVFDDAELSILKKQRLRLKTQLVTMKQEHDFPSIYYNTEQND